MTDIKTPSPSDALSALFREALAWGMTYGPEIPAHQWDEMRESMVLQYVARWGAQPAGEPVARVLLDFSGQPMVNPELLAAKELADPVAFDMMYPHRAPHRVAMLYPDAPPPQAVREPLTPEQITAAAKKLAECMDYPWEHMTHDGRAAMHKHAKAVIEASKGITKGGQHGDSNA